MFITVSYCYYIKKKSNFSFLKKKTKKTKKNKHMLLQFEMSEVPLIPGTNVKFWGCGSRWQNRKILHSLTSIHRCTKSPIMYESIFSEVNLKTM